MLLKSQAHVTFAALLGEVQTKDTQLYIQYSLLATPRNPWFLHFLESK